MTSPSARSVQMVPMTRGPATLQSPPERPSRSFRPAATVGLGKEDTPGARARNDILHATSRLGRMIWRRWSGFHRRSPVKTKMHCFKLVGERVMARDFDRQVAELQIRAAILNRFTAIGTPQTQRVE